MKIQIPAAAIAVAVVMAVCLPAHAVKITNVTTGDLIFESDFETDTLGVLPAGWFTNKGKNKSTVESATTLPSPGPFQGSNYLHVKDSSNLRVDFSSPAEGDQVHAEWMYWIPDEAQVFNTASPFYFGANGSNGGQTVFYNPDNKCDGSVWCPGGHTSFANEQWQKWELDYTVGASTFDLTVDGEKMAGLNAQFPGNYTNIEFVKRSKQPEIDNYIDAVPEPATSALLLIGLLALSGSYRGRRAG